MVRYGFSLGLLIKKLRFFYLHLSVPLLGIAHYYQADTVEETLPSLLKHPKSFSKTCQNSISIGQLYCFLEFKAGDLEWI